MAEDMVLATNDVRLRIEDISNDDNYIAKVAKLGAEKASESARKTLKEVREIIGIKRFY
ncbi:tryptophanyl-tRNA synthetase [compost metagenome]